MRNLSVRNWMLVKGRLEEVMCRPMYGERPVSHRVVLRAESRAESRA